MFKVENSKNLTLVTYLDKFCTRKSFYKKCGVYTVGDGMLYLKSYNTIVCAIIGDTFYKYWDGYSATTIRHIEAFMKYIGKPQYGGKSWWKSLPCNEEIYLD